MLYILGLSSYDNVGFGFQFDFGYGYLITSTSMGSAMSCMFPEAKWDDWVEVLKHCANFRWKHPTHEREREREIHPAPLQILFSVDLTSELALKTTS